MKKINKHQIPSPPAPMPKPVKPTKLPEAILPVEPKLPDIPKSIEKMKEQLKKLRV